MIWKLFNFLNKKYPISTSAQPIVVLGFQRSGTSLLGQILGSLNVYFGQMDYMKKNDFRNPKGFLRRIILFISRIKLQKGLSDPNKAEEAIEKNIHNKLNCSSKKIDFLKKKYPLAQEVIQIHETLKFLKFR